MAEAIKLKSKAVSIYDYHQVDISRFITGFSVDEAQYRKDLDRILRRFGRRESVSQVGSGDAVIVNSRSTLPRFCWDGMTVMVGKGILNREFEAQLIGMTVGERKTVFVDGGEASVEIVSVTRTVLPELTDEIVASFQMGGISTVSDLRRYCIGKQVETFLLEDEVPDTASAFVWQEVAKNSKINRDAEEGAHINCEADRKIWEMTANEDGGGISDGNEEMVRSIFLTELDLAAIGCSVMERDGGVLTYDDYDGFIQRMTEAYPDRSRDDLMQEYDVESFAIERYSDFLSQKIDAYVADCYKAALCG